MTSQWKAISCGRLARLALTSLMIVISGTGFSGLASGQNEFEDRDESNAEPAEVNFNFGDSCERMFDVSEATIMELLKSKNLKHWDRFCRATEPIDCDEFSYLFEGVGFLTPNKKDPKMCRFEPLLEMNDWYPDQFRSYGAVSPMHNSDQNLRLGIAAASEPFGIVDIFRNGQSEPIRNHSVSPFFFELFADRSNVAGNDFQRNMLRTV
jgi:hypothetical protein